jgi:Mg-chelatase subunit ChlD
MCYKRLTQHTIALLVLAAILMLNGCMAPAAAPAAGGAASSGQASAPAAAPAAESARPTPRHDSAAAPAASGAAAPASAGRDHSAGYAPVTAGVTDDNSQWNDYVDYLNRHAYDLYVHRRDVSERYVLHVVDQNHVAVHDATVEIYAGETVVFAGRTDAGGQLLFLPRALDYNAALDRANEFRIVAKKGYTAQSQTFARDGNDQWMVTLNDPRRSGRTQLDMVFLIDATGSMGDEIDKLKASMADVANQIAGLPEAPDVRYGLVAYRDHGDAYVVRTNDFTYDLSQFQNTLAGVYADGGGDTPEALNEALHRTLNDLSWRNEDTVRLVLLVADAPPHLDYNEGFAYDSDMINAVRQGIKIFPIGASNLEADGEYIFRQLAQFTGGKFVFLTYEDGSNPSSGPGTETDHEVDNYSVDTLDRLVVRLVREELAKLTSVVTVAQSPLPAPTSTPAPVQPSTCTIDLTTGNSNCGYINGLRVLQQAYYDQILLHLTLDARSSGFVKARFDITYSDIPTGMSVNISNSFASEGNSPQRQNPADGAEVQMVDGRLLVYGDARTNRRDAIDGNRLLFDLPDAVRRDESISLEIANQRVGINYAGGMETVNGATLFALGEPTNSEIYAAFNRSIAADANGAGQLHGSGISKVVVTLYPVR